MIKQFKIITGLGMSAVLLAGCMSVSPDKAGDQASSGQIGEVVVGSGVGDEKGFYLGSDFSVSAPSNQKYYFDLDKSGVHKEYMASIEAQAKYLVAHPNAQVRLEGNTDEQGSREYNIALGERRSDSIAKALELLGVPAKQIVVVSYGEEHPEALGHDDMAYRMNRRAELIFENKG